jgi:hypothetical protein
MKTFQQYLEENHPETIEEGWGKNLVTAGLIGMAGLGAAGKIQPTINAVKSAVTSDFQDEFDDEDAEMNNYDQKLKIAAQKAGVPKSEFNRLKGHSTGGIVTIVNGKKVPLTPKEQKHVKSIEQLRRSMGN